MDEKQRLIGQIVSKGLRLWMDGIRAQNPGGSASLVYERASKIYDMLARQIQIEDDSLRPILQKVDSLMPLDGTRLRSLSPVLTRVAFQEGDTIRRLFRFRYLDYRDDSLLPVIPQSAADLLPLEMGGVEKVMERLERQCQKMPELVMPGVLGLLEKVGWCVSAGKSDSALYETIRMACAIALCLYEKAENRPPFCLFEGEISGIQHFIYQVSNADGIPGTSKRFRGRSFYLSLLCEMVPRYFLRNIRGYPVQIVFSSGGHFCLLVPNTEENLRILTVCMRELEDWLSQQFEGELRIHFAHLEGDEQNLHYFGHFYGLLQEAMAKAKQHPFTRLVSEGGERAIFPIAVQGAKRLCRSCRLMVVPESQDPKQEMCDPCQKSLQLGKKIPQIEATIFGNENIAPSPEAFSFGPCGNVVLLEDSSDDLAGLERILARIQGKKPAQEIEGDRNRNSRDWPDFYFWNRGDTPFSQFIPNHVAYAMQDMELPMSEEEDMIRKGQILPFELLAKMAIGDSKLGFLKMDVDRLGQIFRIGACQRIDFASGLSRQVDYFFKGLLNTICQEQSEKWRNLPENGFIYKNDVTSCFYICYAGGDDLLTVGPASEMLALAAEIRARFKRYCGANQDVDISAGLFFCRSKYPVAKAVEYANEAIDASKSGGRGRITLFDYTLEWDEFAYAMEMGEKVYGYLQNGLPKTFVRQVLDIRRSYKKTGGLNQHNHIPLLVYQIARNVNDEGQRRYFMENLISHVQAPRVFNYLGVAMNYALLKSRKEK